MTDADRQRLAAILGMLGSEHAGERAAAGLKAEAFRRQHRLTWEEMLQPVVLNISPRQAEPPEPPSASSSPPAWAPSSPPHSGPPASQSWTTLSEVGRVAMIFVYGISPIIIIILAAFLTGLSP